MTKRILMCLGAMMLIISPAQAEQKSDKINLDSYIQTVMERSPEAASIIADTTRAEADAVESIQWNNPELQIDATVAKDNAGREMEIELEQPLRGSDFGARRGFAQAIRTTKNPEQKARLLDLSHEATRAYMDLWLAQEKIALLNRLIKDAARQVKAVNYASEQGLADKGESAIFSTESEELKLQRSSLEAERKAFLNAFVRLSGLPFGDYALESPAQKTLPESAGALNAMADTETSVRSILAGRLNVSERRIAVAKADAALPEFAPRAVLSRDFTDDSSMIKLGVRFALPVWSQNQAEILRAKADYDSTRRALQALEENDYPSVLATAWEAAKDSRIIADKYSASIVPSWRDVQKLTEQKLGLGQANVFDLWQIRTRVLDSETKALEERRAAVEAVLTLENLSGVAFAAPAVKGETP